MFAKNYYLRWTAGRANILCKCLIHTFFRFWAWLLRLFFCFFFLQKFQLLVIKEFWNNFYYIVLVFVWPQRVCLGFLKSYFKLEIINIFVFRGVFFSRYFQLKSSFSDEENISGKILRHTLVEKLSNFNAARY